MSSFEDIRPYTDEELPAAMQRIADWKDFPQAIRFIYPDADIAQMREQLKHIGSIHELQSTVMNDAIRRIIHSTTEGFSYGGLQHLKRNTPYLFISNHRDITLDAFLLQHLLIENGFDTSHIVFGQNLLSVPVMNDLFRCNKLIRMERGGSPRAFYNSLHHLSEYINHIIVNEKHSLWIAQKNGRAKNGVDQTAPAMLKMLCLGGKDDALQTLTALHPVPISISYEWDPCDAMKANELYQSNKGEYHKAPGEDFRSVVAGIIGAKGHVHLEIGRPLTRREMQPAEGEDIYEHVARLLDKRIQYGYHLMPTNFAAYCLLTGQALQGRYTERTESQLLQRIDELPNPESRRLMLEAYAAPLIAVR